MTENIQQLVDTLKSKLATEWDKNARLQADKTHLFESIDKTLDALAIALGAAAVSPEHTDSPAKYVKLLMVERDGYKALAERLREAVKPFALYHQARVQAAPRTSAKDSSIPILSYGKVHLGDKHFREADAALAATPVLKRER